MDSEEARRKAEELKGKAKEEAGEATGSTQWQAEGKYEQASSALKRAGRRVRDALTGESSSSGNG
ncbi:CsbD-like protein [Haloactinospora alba]|uniref:CsbD-like protein n=1 Tax=Haloactinospora alba TaxID=405555 RepID=A0A543NN32_9ACTN|nr:CsbD family protein [Haloactinospora alba]TQN33224.1 CsbD-like protein [Haloactinospora alba]